MNIEVSVEFALSFTKQEIIWLKAIMQNPINGEHPLDESIDNFNLRRELFERLHNLDIE